jgi:hypothetical protein
MWHSGIRDGALLTDLLNGGTFTVADGALRFYNLARGAAFVLEEKY